MGSSMWLSNECLVLDFPYDEKGVAEIKKIQGSKWDKREKVWKVPFSSIAEARDFAINHGFENIDRAILVFDTPKERPGRSVSMEEDWLYLSFPYERVIIKRVKEIPGITWDAKKKAWRAPKSSISSVIEWAKYFDIPVDRELHEYEIGIRQETERLIESSRSTDAEIEVNGLKANLLPYQRAGVQYADNARRTFIADEMGLGKTVQAIAALEYASRNSDIYPAVVVAPPTLILNWQAEYTRWLPHRKTVVIKPGVSDFPERDSYDVVIVGYSNITKWEKDLSGHSSYVFDESHYCKTTTAKRTKSAQKIAKTANPRGMILCLTGTPVTNRPAEYAAQLAILGKLNEFGGLWGFYRRYCNAFQDRFGQWNLSGHSHLDELNDKLRATCYIRRTKDQVLSELPPVIHNPVVVEGSASAMAEYKKAEKDIVQYLIDRAKEIALELGQNVRSAAVSARLKAESNEHLVRLSALRRLSAKAKMPVVEEWVQERISDGKKVVICAHHRDIVDELAKKFGNLRIQGGMDVAEIEEQKKKFQELPVDEAPVIVLSIQASKTGHTLTASQECLFVELPWTPADLDQTYSRLHRLGQKGSVSVTYMLTDGTIDEEIYSLIERKRSVVTVATDGATDITGEDDGALSLLFNIMGI